ncbi:aminoglycoside phosphotransferase family protein [Streptomyces oceani]|uniref:Kinase n=1 Tax=Streptomyces oceani TaxID=1075402 RepID=A0A1E7JRK8_9ACTN|nr:aminoglycoside phosphotransferase family protein [Streptomyces oceani]OEU91369.1 kinase [Streptomyces oceani]
MPSVLPLDPPRRLVRALGSRPDSSLTSGWLTGLPALLERVLEHWELAPERVVSPGGRGSLVVLVRRPDGSPAVLKLAAPPASAAVAEAAALAHWNGWGAVRLLRTLPAEGALLLEQLHGEVSLRSLPDAKAMLEAASAARRLWVTPPAEHPFRTVAEHTSVETDTLRAHAPAEAHALVDEALELRETLVGDAAEALLLHGDFRQGAVLAADSERAPWLAVGPEPLVGERAYDLARLVRDRLHDLMASAGAPAATRRRINKLAEALDVDPDRLRGWTLYRAAASGTRHLASGNREDGEALLEFASWL